MNVEIVAEAALFPEKKYLSGIFVAVNVRTEKMAGNLNSSLKTVHLNRQKKFLPLLLDIWLASPIEKDGVVIPIEDVVKRRSKTILHIDNSLGIKFITFYFKYSIKISSVAGSTKQHLFISLLVFSCQLFSSLSNILLFIFWKVLTVQPSLQEPTGTQLSLR
jgi:hypothetical protein